LKRRETPLETALGLTRLPKPWFVCRRPGCEEKFMQGIGYKTFWCSRDCWVIDPNGQKWTKHVNARRNVETTQRLAKKVAKGQLCSGINKQGKPCGARAKKRHWPFCCDSHKSKAHVPAPGKDYLGNPKRKKKKRKKQKTPQGIPVGDVYTTPLDSKPVQKRNLPYNEYLETKHWKRVAKAVRKAYGNRCQLCHSDSRLNVHHNNYECKWNETLRDVLLLCQDCHRTHHGILEA